MLLSNSQPATYPTAIGNAVPFPLTDDQSGGVPVGLPCGAAREKLPGFRIVELAVEDLASAVQ